jgi:hypothetical protein
MTYACVNDLQRFATQVLRLASELSGVFSTVVFHPGFWGKRTQGVALRAGTRRSFSSLGFPSRMLGQNDDLR